MVARIFKSLSGILLSFPESELRCFQVVYRWIIILVIMYLVLHYYYLI